MMISNKKAIVGKILLGILLVVVLFFIFVGISIHQLYSSAQTIKDEIPKIKNTVQDILDTRDCSRTSEIYASQDKIFNEFNSICSNPILRFSITKISLISVKCDDVDRINQDTISEIDKFESLCLDGQNLTDSKDFSETTILELESLGDI